MSSLLATVQDAGIALLAGAYALLWPTLAFMALALLVKGREAISALGRAAAEIRINLGLYFLDTLFMLPLTGMVLASLGGLMLDYHLTLATPAFWERLGTYPVLVLVVFAGDFIGYWRHRLEHTSLIWPAHAVHHSDTEMTWLTLERFHPVNRLVTSGVDTLFLAALGFPDWALVANILVRHYYGYFIHADLPWTFGPLSWVFVSPAMHRWHHARELRYAGTNFATVFSLFDRLFGTLSVPGPCTVPLGIEDDMGEGVFGQLAYPFRIWFAPWLKPKSAGGAVLPQAPLDAGRATPRS